LAYAESTCLLKYKLIILGDGLNREVAAASKDGLEDVVLFRVAKIHI
jgi:hypothetical protein